MTAKRAKGILVLVAVSLALLYGFAVASHFTPRRGATSKTHETSALPRGTIYASQALNYVGQMKTVQFHVGYTYTDAAGTEFLDQYENYQSGFVVTIFASDVGRFTVDPAFTFDSQTIDVTGVISSYDGYLEILNPIRIGLA